MIVQLITASIIALALTYFLVDNQWVFWFTLTCVILAFTFIWAKLQ